jgi:uncharacterized membrane protein
MEFNAAHLHLLLNHVPILGAVAAALLLTLALFVRRQVLTKAALWTLAVAGVVSVPVYLSGEAAEDIVEELGAAHAVIESHEEAALLTLIALGALGLLAVGFLWWTSHQYEVPRWVTGTMWILASIGAVLAARTAYLGGQIRHTEIRPPEVRQQLEEASVGEDLRPGEAASPSTEPGGKAGSAVVAASPGGV